MMMVHVEKDECIGCEACPSICPEIFAMDDDGLAIALKEQVPPELEESAQEAAEDCPTDAIVIS